MAPAGATRAAALETIDPISPRVAVERAIEALGHGSVLVATDFDGTIAQLVPDPWGARILPAAQRALRRLAATPDVRVALISGRTVADLAARARVGGISYRGDHGAERAEAVRRFRASVLRVEREGATEAEEAMARELARIVPRLVAEPWLVVEWKGSAVTFHWRMAPDLDLARRRVVEAVARIDPNGLLRPSGGRRALELRPAAASHKGDALTDLIAVHRPQGVLMLGDDPSDVPAFEVLRSARGAGRLEGLAIAVAGRADVSAAVAARADLSLRGPLDAGRFLAALAGAIARRAG